MNYTNYKNLDEIMEALRGGKVCSRCKELKNYDEFHRRLSTKDGYCYHCIDCDKYYKKQKIKKLEGMEPPKYKLCNECKRTKSIQFFRVSKSARDGFAYKCKECWKKCYSDIWHKKNRHKTIERDKIRDKEFWEIIDKHKRQPCKICDKIFHPVAMDFHHRDKSDKKYLIAHMNFHSKKNLEAEIAKCDVVCANCHRILEYEKKESERY